MRIKGDKLMIISYVISGDDVSKVEQLFRAYEKPIFYYLYNFLKEQHLAEDALQTVFIKIIKNIDKITEVSSKETKNYIYKIAKNTAINFYNKIKKEQAVTKEYDEMVINIIDEKDAIEIIARQDMSEELENCLSLLSDSDKDIISLKYGLEWSDQQIAKHYEITEQSVRQRLSRARKRLANIIKQNTTKRKEA